MSATARELPTLGAAGGLARVPPGYPPASKRLGVGACHLVELWWAPAEHEEQDELASCTADQAGRPPRTAGGRRWLCLLHATLGGPLGLRRPCAHCWHRSAMEAPAQKYALVAYHQSAFEGRNLHLVGHVTCTFAQLVAKFGKPGKGDPWKMTANWDLVF